MTVKTCHFHLEPLQIKFITEVSKDLKVSRSELVRYIVADFIDEIIRQKTKKHARSKKN